MFVKLYTHIIFSFNTVLKFILFKKNNKQIKRHAWCFLADGIQTASIERTESKLIGSSTWWKTNMYFVQSSHNVQVRIMSPHERTCHGREGPVAARMILSYGQINWTKTYVKTNLQQI